MQKKLTKKQRQKVELFYQLAENAKCKFIEMMRSSINEEKVILGVELNAILQTLITVFYQEIGEDILDLIKKSSLIELDKENSPQEVTSKLEKIERDETSSNQSSKDKIIKTMKKMRKKGWTYEEIATSFNAEKVPTFSKRGNWHAQTIHRLCNNL